MGFIPLLSFSPEEWAVVAQKFLLDPGGASSGLAEAHGGRAAAGTTAPCAVAWPVRATGQPCVPTVLTTC